MHVKCVYPGSVGEIIQGNYNGKDILVSCPINLYTKVTLFECKKAMYKQNYKKSLRFLHSILEKWGFLNYENSLDIKISSNIPKSKGFASSTADLCALYKALIKLFHKEFSIDELICECIKIEPTDSIIFKEMTVFEYKNGIYKKKLGNYMEFYILVFEGSKIVNTVEFNNENNSKLTSVNDLMNLITKGIKEKNIEDIALASTESIMRNQYRIRYEIIDEVLKIQESTGGLGIIGAHSGDMLGIIYDDEAKIDRVLKNNINIKGYKVYKIKTIDKIT